MTARRFRSLATHFPVIECGECLVPSRLSPALELPDWSCMAMQGKVWLLMGCRYNLDAVNGAPFKGQNVKVTSDGAGTIEWPHGEDIGDVTRDNAADKDIVLVVSGKV